MDMAWDPLTGESLLDQVLVVLLVSILVYFLVVLQYQYWYLYWIWQESDFVIKRTLRVLTPAEKAMSEDSQHLQQGLTFKGKIINNIIDIIIILVIITIIIHILLFNIALFSEESASSRKSSRRKSSHLVCFILS